MYVYLKRLLDIMFALLLLTILAPILGLVALSIRLSMGKPVLFRQERTGKSNTTFSIIKFRTMTNKTDVNLSDTQRLTKVGAILRKTSLDELPQIVNILKGDMSFIGPRPLLVDYLPYYNSREIQRHKIRPGMSSLAGVKGRSNLTWEEQFKIDIFYVENMSFCLDIEIFCKTIPKVLGSTDVMVLGRKNQDRFDVFRRKQIDSLQSKQRISH